MQLSKLEIKGFKSFGEKVIINFDAGITGIVGPNGCGKSNVVDAIRWVLGEQSTKALRSDKMENVIFNGTKNRKAQQLAEVSLTFNNTKNLLPTEYSQVTITRRYYRSGESEYLLNNVTCRLKDINNLFLDTGIGSDTYAIIELKMVDNILNDKDHSRRELFEEAAGISKFKIRKKETLRKLDDTDQNLERVEDLLFEISKNLKSLEKQAKQTQNYFILKEEYKLYSVALARKTINRQRETVERLKAQILTEQERKALFHTQIAERDALIEKEKTALLGKEKTLASRQKALNDHVGKIRQYENEKNIKNERLRFLNDKIKALNEQIELDKNNNELLERDIERLESDKVNAEFEAEAFSITIQQIQDDYALQKQLVNDIQNELNEANKSFRENQDEAYQIRKQLDIKQTQLDAFRQELQRNEDSENIQTFDIEDLSERLYDLQEKVSEAELRLEEDEKIFINIKKELDELNTDIENLRKQIADSNRNIDAKQNEYNLTKSLVDNLEGFPEAIKFLKQHDKEIKNVPLLSDILSCKDDYRITIENYLENFMNYFVVQTQNQALQAVNLLSDSAKGKANFFILDNFENFKPQITNSNAFLKVIDAIEFDKQYESLLNYLLENVFIVKNERDVPEQDENTYLSESGKIIKRLYSISGGSIGLFEGKRIGRVKNIDKLSEEIKTSSALFNQFNLQLIEKQKSKTDLLQKIDLLERNKNASQQNLHTVKQEYVSVRTRQDQLKEMITVQIVRKDDIQSKIIHLDNNIHFLKPDADERELELKEQEEKIYQQNLNLKTQNEILETKSNDFNQRNILFYQIKNKVSTLNQEINFKKQNTDAVLKRLNKNINDLQSTEDDLKRLLESNEIQEDQLINLYTEKEAITTGVTEAETDYYKTRGEVDKWEKDLREIQRTRESSDSLLMELQNKQNEAKLQLMSVQERLSVEFEVNVDQLQLIADEKEEKIGNLNEEEIREKAYSIKSNMDKIGPINPLALEAYEEMKERSDFINTQKQDLIEAKNSLLNTISEIELVACETFTAAFGKIRENFIKVFRSLFSDEDSCDLKLTDEKNPLESTIEIIAKPRGKRPLTINQLSGGEKTLTAISLLFAIYLIKPAPFCIFDEVDAPLDDANIDKFNNIIKKFSEESQFIIVTHNKRTMASVDTIYGVSMMLQDYGVSRVVPVDLRELA